MLQVIYGLLRERSAPPTFGTVDLHYDRPLGVADAQAALAAVRPGYLQRAWRTVGFSYNDEARLSLHSIFKCPGWPDGLELLTRFVRFPRPVLPPSLSEHPAAELSVDDSAQLGGNRRQPDHIA